MLVKEERVRYTPDFDIQVSYPVKTIQAEKEITLYNAFWMFVFGSVMGYVVETLYCFAKNGTIECRSSMLFGPFNVIYGIGALAMYISLHKVKSKNVHLVFIFGMASGTVVEFIASWVQQTAFGSVSWDYSRLPLNIGGRVSLLYTAFWGILVVLWIKAIQPLLERLISLIPKRIGKMIAVCLIAFLVLDVVISGIAVVRWGMRINGVSTANSIATYIDRLFPNEFMERVYNNMMFVK